MPFNGSGTFTLYTPGTPFVTGTTISSTVMNNVMNDIANNGLTKCVTVDGQSTVTANIPMAGFKFTGLGAGSASGNSIRYEQVNGVVTTAGDILYATGAGVLARLAIGTASQSLIVNSGATAPQWSNANAARVIRTAANVTTTSTSLVDFTGATATITTGANPVGVGFVASAFHSVDGTNVRLNIDVDGSLELGTTGLVITLNTSDIRNVSFAHQTAALSAASHTIKLQWSTAAGTATVQASSASAASYWVREIR